MQGCVISAFEIRDSHTENDIRKKIIDAFGEKLKDLPEPKFKLVRAVGNKIIDPFCQTYSGKVLKYLNKQGPIYVCAVSAISEQDLSDEENFYMDSDEDILMISAFEQKGISSNKSNDEMQVNQGASTFQNAEREKGSMVQQGSTDNLVIVTVHVQKKSTTLHATEVIHQVKLQNMWTDVLTLQMVFLLVDKHMEI